MQKIRETNNKKQGHKRKIGKICGWCEVETFVDKNELICPNCNKKGYQ